MGHGPHRVAKGQQTEAIQTWVVYFHSFIFSSFQFLWKAELLHKKRWLLTIIFFRVKIRCLRLETQHVHQTQIWVALENICDLSSLYQQNVSCLCHVQYVTKQRLWHFITFWIRRVARGAMGAIAPPNSKSCIKNAWVKIKVFQEILQCKSTQLLRNLSYFSF